MYLIFSKVISAIHNRTTKNDIITDINDISHIGQQNIILLFQNFYIPWE